MDKLKLKEHVEVIREAFGYINRFKGRTFVIRIDDELISHPFFPLLIKDIVLLHRMGIRIIVIPGAKKRIDEILAAYKVSCATIDGTRITSAEAIPFIKMAAFDVSNKIMTMLAGDDADAVVGNWVRARGIGVRKGIDFQHSGIVEKVKSDIVSNILSQGLIPIFPNIGWSATGKPYNISSGELALAIAVEMQASKIFYISDLPGVSSRNLRIPKGVYVTSEGIVPQFTVDEAAEFLNLNQATKRNRCVDIVTLAHRACRAGIDRVHIIDGRVEGMLLKEIFSNRGLGTMVYGNQHENVRPMTFADIPEVLRLMQPSIEDETLLPRAGADLERDVSEYAVYEVDGIIHASGALHVYPDRQAEVCALAVDEMYANLGTGRKIITYLIDRARNLKLRRVFLLTTQAADWFVKAGFKEARIADLPKERRAAYDPQRNSRVMVLVLTGHRQRGTAGVE